MGAGALTGLRAQRLGAHPPTPEWKSDNWANPACTQVRVSALGFVPKVGPPATDPASLQLWVSHSELHKLKG